MFSDVNLVQDLQSSLANHDALVIVATQLDEITGFVSGSVVNDLQGFLHVRIKQKLNERFILIFS